jgi:peptide chain release factor 1
LRFGGRVAFFAACPLMNLRPYIEKFERRLNEVEAALSDPRLAGNAPKLQEMSREYARLKDLTATGQRYLKVRDELAQHAQLLQTEPAESEMAQLTRQEITQLQLEEQRLAKQVQLGLAPPDPADSRNTIIEIRAGAGGSESALFAADLYRMYTRYAADHGWKTEDMDSSPSDLGGFKEVIFGVTGVDVFKRLKYESGVHRVQRVPATEAQGRIHTSTATVAVLPEAREVDLEIKPEDLEINVCRASGKGGQGVNTTDSAVQIIYKPTGMIVRCADERSQQKNRVKAMTVLRSRLLELKVAEENARYAARRKEQVGTGERNERIRTYNFPQNRVTDHRIELTLHNLPTFIDGDLDGIIEPLMADDLEHRLAALPL